MTLLIRSAALPDSADLHRMIHSLARHHGDVPSISLAQLHRDLFTQTPWAHALVAEWGGGLCGYGILVPQWKAQTAMRGVELHHLFVDPAARGRGVGRALVAACQAHARQIGAGRFSVGTHPGNSAAQAFYLAVGLQPAPTPGPRYVTAL